MSDLVGYGEIVENSKPVVPAEVQDAIRTLIRWA